MAAAVDEGLEDFAEGLRCLFAGDCDAEGDDLVVAVDSREDSHCVLPAIRSDVPDDIVGQVVADCLTVLLEVLFHLRADYHEDPRQLSFSERKGVNAQVVVLLLQFLDDLVQCCGEPSEPESPEKYLL